jgi:acyl-homoserine-lactone acylase
VAAAALLLALLPLWPLGASGPAAERVTITRDRFGIPHIEGATEEAVAFGLGYAQAEDHIETIARQVLEARGVAARVFGRAHAEQDFLMRRMRNFEESISHLGELDGTYRKVVRAFSAGVNHYVGRHRAELPDWVPETGEGDFVAITRAGGLGSVRSSSMIRALEAKYGTTSVTTSTDAETDWLEDAPGSNALALSGARTVSGHPILLGNPHLRWASHYWEAHVRIPGRLNFYGSTLAGFPWLRAGFNDSLGYVQTNNAPDLSDVFALPLDEAKADHYRFERRLRPLARQEVTVTIKEEDGSLVQETRTFWSSHLGPIVYRTPQLAFAYRSTTLDAFRAFEGFWRLSHARSLQDFDDVMKRRLLPTSNFTYADAAGNILYYWNARLPKRAPGVTYELDVPGESNRYMWRGLHDVSDLPRLLNPPGGYVQNANNPPWFVSKLDPISADAFASYIERGELALRPQLALDMLGAREKFDVADVLALKFSTRLLLAERVKADLLAASAVPHPTEDLAEGKAIIEAWDGRAAAQSRGAILFQRFWERYRQATRDRQPFARPWDAGRPFDTPSGLADHLAAVQSLEEAVRETRAAYGSARVAYGDVNRFRFEGIDVPGDGASGQLGAYRVVQFDATPGHRVRVAGRPDPRGPCLGFGDAWILLVHFTRPVSAMSVLAYGQSSRPGSPHGADQIRIYAAHQLRPVWFTREEVAANAERVYQP